MTRLMNPVQNDYQNDLLPKAYKSYSKTQLLHVIKNLWCNTHVLANLLDDARPDISHALDCILLGQKYPTDGMDDSKFYAMIGKSIIEFDCKARQFTRWNMVTNQITITETMNTDGLKKNNLIFPVVSHT